MTMCDWSEGSAAASLGRVACSVAATADPGDVGTRGTIITFDGEVGRFMAGAELHLAYQPKLSLQLGHYTGVEALLRWRGRGRAEESSGGHLIAAAEASGQIGTLSLWILQRAIDDQRRLARSHGDLRFNINISGDSLDNDEFMTRACEMAREAAGPVGFEITETAFIADPAAALVNMKRLVAAGIELSIDDYGSGHSSLAYIKELPAAELKIDKLFISGMTRSNRDPLIVRSTIDLAHALGMRVVAEGVESHATLALLRAMGCDMAQGYFISPALSFGALAEFLGDSSRLERLNDPRFSLNPSPEFWVRNEHQSSGEATDEHRSQQI